MATTPPPFAVPDVLLHMTTTRSAKQWLPDYWRVLIDWCLASGLSVGVLGSKPQIERERYHSGDWEERMIAELGLHDLRGATSLTDLAGAFARARRRGRGRRADAYRCCGRLPDRLYLWQRRRWRWREPDPPVGAARPAHLGCADARKMHSLY